MKKNILFILLSLFALLPMFAMEEQEPNQKRLKATPSSPDLAFEQELEIADVVAAIQNIPPYPCPPAMPITPEMEHHYHQLEQEHQKKQQKLNHQLLSAAADGDCKWITELLGRGAQINSRNRFERSQGGGSHNIWANVCALELAAFFGRSEACELLLKQKATLTDTCLFEAVKQPNPLVCKILIDAGANVNIQDQGGSTALINAAQEGHADVCAFLLERGAYVNAQNNQGQTALMLAAMFHYEYVCKILICAGADVHIVDFENTPTLHYASHNGHIHICALLLAHQANPNAIDAKGITPLIDCIESSCVNQEQTLACAKIFLAYGANPNMQDKGENSALMSAAYYGHQPVCELLIQYDADHSFTDKYGNNANAQAIQGENDISFDFEGENNYMRIRALLNDPEKIRAVILRADNPRLPVQLKKGGNRCLAIMNRELGLK